MGIFHVELAKKAKRDLQKTPRYIADKLLAWTLGVEKFGLEEMMKLKGFHDEPLAGERKGQRSIRLNRSYRAIYVIKVTRLSL